MNSLAIAGFERAVEDLDAVVRHLRERLDVDQSQLAIVGVSRGGILSIAYAGTRFIDERLEIFYLALEGI
ncbi:S9 family peptidase [Rhizobium ruizarguesonis]|uniref:S9 family peptidase n=1 Tax=Rhizobium ruizarguesonis TaxID=2081791 RepID=UPI001FDFCD4B|nr:S9 family peptidase [Rhizobium ruizarguesonis]